jgi:hypothetical protein
MRVSALLFVCAVSLFACTGSTAGDGGDAASDAANDVVTDTVDPATTDCDPLVPQVCAMPWPSNLYLQPDSTRRTGYTLTFGATSLPANQLDQFPATDAFRRLDGYGVGTPIMVVFPNVDISTWPGENSIERSIDPTANALLLRVDGTTLTRVPYWVELDTHETDPARKTLFMRPAVILDEAAHYIVVFRNVHDTSGQAIAPSAAFVALRDHATSSMPQLAARQDRFDAMFALLEQNGIPRESLTLAWDFNTASGEALHGTLLSMRDAALAATGPMGPELTVTHVTEYVQSDDGSGREVNANIAVELTGTFHVPSFLKPFRNGSFSGTVLDLDANGAPMANGTRDPAFWIRIPWSAVDGMHTPHGILIYGHGLLGSGDESRGGYLGEIANREHLITVAANLTGMSQNEFALVLGALDEVGNFVTIGDTLHQGLVEWVLLARAARERLASLPDAMTRGVTVNRDEVFYSGNSQGGIFGGTYVAISPDIRYGHLGVPGLNYSMLLHRSKDFERFFMLLQSEYPNVEDQAIGIAALQLLWDFTDPVSYWRHITAEPFDPASPHYVIATPAKGDHQVAVITNEVGARSNLGIELMANYDDERMPALVTQHAYPYRGSGIVLYDFGNPWPSPGNHVPEDTMTDPHELPRRARNAQDQMIHFFRNAGEIIDVCGGDGCHPD